MNIYYKLYKKDEEMIVEFQSNWMFRIGEKISIDLEHKKRTFRIINIAHNVEKNKDNIHVVKVYVEEEIAYH